MEVKLEDRPSARRLELVSCITRIGSDRGGRPRIEGGDEEEAKEEGKNGACTLACMFLQAT